MAISNFKIKEISLEKDGTVHDFTRGITQIDYYEDVLSPTVVCDMTFVDGDGVAGRLPINGGELVNVEIESGFPTKQKLMFRTEDDNPLCVMNSSIMPTPQNQMFTLRLMSDDVLKNETSRVVKKYSAKVSEIVQKILKDEDNLIQTKRELNIDSTGNSYSFIGSFKRPFDVITWLCPKSNTSSNSSKKSDGTASCGFLFFETKFGYNFIDIDNTFKTESDPLQLLQSNTPLQPSNVQYYRTFSDIQIVKNNDVLKSLRHGTYAHLSIFYDMYTMDYDVIKTKLSDKYKNGMSVSNPDAESVSLNGLEDYPSRLMFKLLDRGVMETEGEQLEPEQVAKDQANSYMRYNLLFANAVKITLPLNLELSAGKIVELKIAETGINTKTTKDKYDRNLSGRYMISKLRHSFLGENNFTALELIRDSYGVKSE